MSPKMWFWLALPAVSMALSACGGGEGTPSGMPPAPSPTTAPTEVPVATSFLRFGDAALTTGLEDSLTLDRDGDGLPDAIDPYPEIPALQDDPANPLSIDWLGARPPAAEGLEGVAHADHPLQLRVRGAVAGEPLFVVLGLDEGLRVLPVTLRDGVIELPAERLATPLRGVSVMTARWRSPARPLHWVAPGSAWAQAPSAVRRGEALALEGLNLEGAVLRLSGEPLAVLEAATSSLTAALPAQAMSGLLELLTAEGEVSQQWWLTVHRPVEFTLDPALSALLPEIHWFEGDVQRSAATGAAFRRWVPAQDDSLHLLFRPDPLRPALPLTVRVPADAERVRLSAESLLAGLAYGQRRQAQPAVSDDADAVWQAIEQVLLEAEGQALRDRFEAAWADYDALDDRELRQALTALLQDRLPTPIEARLFYAGGTDSTVYDQNVRVRNYNSGNGYSVLARKEYSNFRVALADPSLSIFERCNTASLPARPASAWPSDLCIENDNVVIASVAVFTGDGQNRRYLSQHVATQQGGRPRSPIDIMLDSNLLGGNTGGLLRLASHQYLMSSGESPQPLCRLMPCSVEIITGGLGYADSTPLEGSSQRRLADALQKRAFIETLVLPVIAQGLGISSQNAPETVGCLTSVISDAMGTMLFTADFAAKLREVRSASGGIDRAKLETFVLELLQGTILKVAEVLPSSGLSCASALLQGQTGNLAQRLTSTLSGAAGRALIVAGIIDTSVSVVEFATTPRRIVFDVKPVLAENTRYTRTLSLAAGGGASRLEITGLGIAKNEQGAGQRYFPSLVFQGRWLSNGAPLTEVVPLNASHFENTGNLGEARLTLSGAEVRDLLEGVFRPGSLQLSLRYDHRPYPGFPQNRVDFPLGEVVYRGLPAVNEMSTTIIPAGEVLQLRGEHLQEVQSYEVIFAAERGGEVVTDRPVRLVYLDTTPSNLKVVLEVEVPRFVRENNNPVRHYSVSVVLDGRLQELGNLMVVDSSPGTVTVADTGACDTDDTAEVALLREDGQPSVFLSSLGIPNPVVIGPAQGSRASLTWLNELVSPANHVKTIRITCVDGGNDCRSGQESRGVCTFTVAVDIPGGGRFTTFETVDEGDYFFVPASPD